MTLPKRVETSGFACASEVAWQGGGHRSSCLGGLVAAVPKKKSADARFDFRREPPPQLPKRPAHSPKTKRQTQLPILAKICVTEFTLNTFLGKPYPPIPKRSPASVLTKYQRPSTLVTPKMKNLNFSHTTSRPKRVCVVSLSGHFSIPMVFCMAVTKTVAAKNVLSK